ncbi:MAG: hypothetical protein Q8K02_10090, partial [Flavobacterium sp.]|nr:hypothetical protein [Flavobacterium sp.]
IKQEGYKKKQSESGLRGVEVKKEWHIYPFIKSSDPSSDPSSEHQALQSSSSSSLDKESTNVLSRECEHRKIIDLYHTVLPELPKIRKWGKTSQKYLQARWKESPDYQNLNWWQEFFQNIRQSKFLMGQKTDFQASLGWIVKPTNFEKIINEQYHHDKEDSWKQF